MKLKDLMVGDWVHSKLHNVDTVIIDVEGKVLKDQPELEYTESVSVWLSSKACWERHYLGEIEPIPLTEKILTDSGFIRLENGVYTNIYALNVSGESDKEDCFYFSVNGKMENPDSIKIMFVPYSRTFWLDLIIRSCYVHELQHILRLCGIEKEIIIKK